MHGNTIMHGRTIMHGHTIMHGRIVATMRLLLCMVILLCIRGHIVLCDHYYACILCILCVLCVMLLIEFLASLLKSKNKVGGEPVDALQHGPSSFIEGIRYYCQCPNAVRGFLHHGNHTGCHQSARHYLVDPGVCQYQALVAYDRELDPRASACHD